MRDEDLLQLRAWEQQFGTFMPALIRAEWQLEEARARLPQVFSSDGATFELLMSDLEDEVVDAKKNVSMYAVRKYGNPKDGGYSTTLDHTLWTFA